MELKMQVMILLLINGIFSILSFRTPFNYPGEKSLLINKKDFSVIAGFLTINFAGAPSK